MELFVIRKALTYLFRRFTSKDNADFEVNYIMQIVEKVMSNYEK